MNNKDWFIFKGINKKHTDDIVFPNPPPWRIGKSSISNVYIPDESSNELEIVNAAIYLKRPILITGSPGTGKSSLAYAIAKELDLELVKWEITSKTLLKDGLYSYDAIGRLQAHSLEEGVNINKFLFLGSLGYSFLDTNKPKVLLIDEIDKGDIDLPNDLLHIFEEMEFIIPELERSDKNGKGINIYPFHKKKTQGGDSYKIKNGKITCKPENFPIIIMTSNGEKEFPPAFLRRSLRLDMKLPEKERLIKIIKAHFNRISTEKMETSNEIVDEFLLLINNKNLILSIDQLLNAIQLLVEKDINILDSKLKNTIFKSLE